MHTVVSQQYLALCNLTPMQRIDVSLYLVDVLPTVDKLRGYYAGQVVRAATAAAAAGATMAVEDLSVLATGSTRSVCPRTSCRVYM